mmetsp:Transcript_12388/g.15476  ORF Transcript_12388/g.15476 Transcript_12388/m.15476 type:complete len:101 (+) Transcript_12388:122-424(+)
MVQPNEVVNVWLYVDEWSRCIGSGYQKDAIYRHGEFDSCSKQWKDLKMAFRAKSSSDPDVARGILAETHYKRHLGSDPANSPTAGFIWDLKAKPGWETED